MALTLLTPGAASPAIWTWTLIWGEGGSPKVHHLEPPLRPDPKLSLWDI